MLGTWFRLKYPHLMDGVIAGSGAGATSAQRADSMGRDASQPCIRHSAGEAQAGVSLK
jgi:hypothetical protein